MSQRKFLKTLTILSSVGFPLLTASCQNNSSEVQQALNSHKGADKLYESLSDASSVEKYACSYVSSGLQLTNEFKSKSKKVQKLNAIWAERANLHSCETSSSAKRIASQQLMAGNKEWEERVFAIQKKENERIAALPPYRDCSSELGVAKYTLGKTYNGMQLLTYRCKKRDDSIAMLEEIKFSYSEEYKKKNIKNRETRKELNRRNFGKDAPRLFSEDVMFVSERSDGIRFRRVFDNCSPIQAKKFTCTDQFNSTYTLQLRE
jgi:hypothetical protein